MSEELERLVGDLRETLGKLEIALSKVREAMVWTDSNGRIQWCNQQFDELVNSPHIMTLGKPIFELLVPTCIDGDKAQALITGLLNQAQEFYEELEINKKNEHGIFTFYGTQINNDNAMFVLSDVSSRKVLEQQLLQAQKMESMGSLAAGVAHEINTPIQYIGDNLSFLQDETRNMLDALILMNQFVCGSDNMDKLRGEIKMVFEELDFEYLQDEIPEAITQAQQGVAHVSKIVQSIKAFSHPNIQASKQAQNLAELIENVVTLSTNEWKYIADLNLELTDEIADVPVISNEMSQTLLNLIVNAAHAIEDCVKAEKYQRGLITIKTLKKDKQVEIIVSDNAGGIPAELHDKIFDPFFTTKDVGKGTGQGLAIAYNSIVNNMQGNLTFNSEVGQGTAFIITLPLED